MKSVFGFNLCSAIVVLLFTANAPAQEVRATRHVYGKAAPEDQVLDAHLLLGERPSPVLVQIISGGWTSHPPKETVAGQFDVYHKLGYSVVTVCHRTIDTNVSWPVPAEDVSRAIQFIRLHADDWNIDPKRVSITGRSSGGHIAMMVGFGKDQANPASNDPVCRQSSDVRCVIEQGGPTDFVPHMRALLGRGQRSAYLSARLQALLSIKPDQVGTEEFYLRLKEISPISLVDKNTVPVLMLYTGPEGVSSRNDPRLKWEVHTPISGLILAEKLERLGVEHELVIAPNLGRSSSRSITAQAAFLKKHMSR